MVTIRKSKERGHARHGWLDSHHTFSFANYYDPAHMGFSALRVINEDRIEGGTGFPTHPHRDMEIISYVIEGALEHKDSMGNATIIRPGEVQRMSAGTGVRHSEYNHDRKNETHFLQIWILPDGEGYEPGYGQKSFSEEFESGKLVHVISPDGRNGTISIHQDANLYIANSKLAGEEIVPASPSRNYWVQVVKGDVKVNGHSLASGDGAALTKEEKLSLQWSERSEFLVFDLP